MKGILPLLGRQRRNIVVLQLLGAVVDENVQLTVELFEVRLDGLAAVVFGLEVSRDEMDLPARGLLGNVVTDSLGVLGAECE